MAEVYVLLNHFPAMVHAIHPKDESQLKLNEDGPHLSQVGYWIQQWARPTEKPVHMIAHPWAEIVLYGIYPMFLVCVATLTTCTAFITLTCTKDQKPSLCVFFRLKPEKIDMETVTRDTLDRALQHLCGLKVERKTSMLFYQLWYPLHQASCRAGRCDRSVSVHVRCQQDAWNDKPARCDTCYLYKFMRDDGMDAHPLEHGDCTLYKPLTAMYAEWMKDRGNSTWEFQESGYLYKAVRTASFGNAVLVEVLQPSVPTVDHSYVLNDRPFVSLSEFVSFLKTARKGRKKSDEDLRSAKQRSASSTPRSSPRVGSSQSGGEKGGPSDAPGGSLHRTVGR